MMKRTKNHQSSDAAAMACRDARDETAAEREHREKVKAVSDRVRAENREILNRLATK